MSEEITHEENTNSNTDNGNGLAESDSMIRTSGDGVYTAIAGK